MAQTFAELIERESRTRKRLPNVVHHAVCIHGSSGSLKPFEQMYHSSTYRMTAGHGDQSSQTGEKTASTGTWNHTQALPPKMGSVGVLF
jgi:hypothetical protein